MINVHYKHTNDTNFFTCEEKISHVKTRCEMKKQLILKIFTCEY
jgi:hypothetical protein